MNLSTYDAVVEALLWRLWYPLSNDGGIVILARNTLRAPNNSLTDSIVREFAMKSSACEIAMRRGEMSLQKPIG